ncbi:ComEC/Rec2 family competence protein [Granulibacter bethesdensis]|uniref:DNA translocation competence protein ComA n=1 Tax=Granulibacter bethesdensis (strain ATCC BAA-1260 / CGDNIH1) TaxID=391165 RepID=Q0BTY9_GRABC|nr:ComEC/Rec2 family competence protein [Granulibacter bethesdensis]ABI61713.1 DNA translocation competence protein ComA [Granulibacter bethesdensis CGDNIH1]APH51521.1 DNA translocation competence protein ComA [Granulibacter bethesdensis]APH64214.1 DNA translocation competence protein ComA [Granulibacter bethesdensis]
MQPLIYLRRASQSARDAAGVLAGQQFGRFSLWLPVGMVTGDYLYFLAPTEPPVWMGFAALGLMICLLVAGWLSPILRAVAGMGLAMALGWSAGQHATLTALPLEPVPNRAVIVEGMVTAVETGPDWRRIVVAAPWLDGVTHWQRSVRLRVRDGDHTSLQSGDRISVRALIRPPPWPAYPGAMDRQRDAFFSRIGAFGFALAPVSHLVSRQDAVSIRLARVREMIAEHVRTALPGHEGAVATALLTGDTASIPQSIRILFRDTGLAHLLAIAGLHIAIVMGTIFAVTRWLLTRSEYMALFWPCRQIAAVISLLSGIAYAVLTGLHVPIIRSAVMAMIACLALFLGRRALSMRGLAIAAALIVLIWPYEVTGVSFQMSFAAVMALAAGYEALGPWLASLAGRRVLHHLTAVALTSLLAGTASAPYGIYHFGQLQLYFVATNLIAVPLMAFWVMPAGLLAMALMPLGLDRPVFVVMGIGIRLILTVAKLVAALPAAVLAVPPMPGWGLFMISAGLIWLCLWRGRVRLCGVPVMVAGIASVWLTVHADLLISADARMVAVKAGPRVFAFDKGSSPLLTEAWQAYWGVKDFTPLSVAGRLATHMARCGESGCLVTPVPGAPRVFLKTGEGTEICQPGALAVILDGWSSQCRDQPVISLSQIREEGSIAVWFRPGRISVLTDRAWRGDRPWVQPPPDTSPGQWKAPLARTDETIPQ